MPRAMTIAVIIPCYRVAAHIEAVVRGIPPWITHIVAVNDASPDETRAILESLLSTEPRLRVLTHDTNQGVGGAMVTGYQKGLDLGADILVKVDGDGQMDTGLIAQLIQPLVEGRVDYAKGNRFRHAASLASMPKLRLLGNIAMTILTKTASGYWHVFDPQNGFVAISREALSRIRLDGLDHSYFFENSMLVRLNIEGMSVADVPMPARYGDERSSLRISRVMLQFPVKLFVMAIKRIALKYLVYDVSPIIVFLGAALVSLSFSLTFGLYHWSLSLSTGTPASAGTVVLALLPFLLGFQFLMQALNLDIAESPRPRPPQRQIPETEVPSLFAPPGNR